MTRCRTSMVRACLRQGASACAPTTTTTTAPATTTTLTPTTTTRPSTTTTTLPTNRLNLLIGRWSFTYTIVSTWTDHYNLTSIQQTSSGWYGVYGTNTDVGNPVLAARVHDVDPDNTLPYEFALLDPQSYSFCEFFVFNVVGASTAQGEVLFLDGECEYPLSNIPYNFQGARY